MLSRSSVASRWQLLAIGFAFCCGADAFVLHAALTGRQITLGQMRRGYFELFDGAVGLAVDDIIRPAFPQCALDNQGALAVPPGMTVVLPLPSNARYELSYTPQLAPYVVLGTEAPLAPGPRSRAPLPGQARVVEGRTLDLEGDRLILVPWDARRTWAEDEARLSKLFRTCNDGAPTLLLAASAAPGHLDLRLGRCSLVEPLPAASSHLLAALPGPDWLTIARQPRWLAERWILWPVAAAIALKVTALWWSLGLASAIATSAALGLAAFIVPVLATLTWPLLGGFALIAAAARAAWVLLPRALGIAAAVALLLLIGTGVFIRSGQPRSFPPIRRTHLDHGQPDTCAVIGYSAAGGASLRASAMGIEYEGFREFLDDKCEPCRNGAASLTAGGETLDWAREGYCSSPPSFGANGAVYFFGGANDDFLWGTASIARLFIVSDQGIDEWRRNQAPAIAGSLARVDRQTAAIEGLIRCVRDRGARFVFLHDFLVTDLVHGREPDRALMLARRREAVEHAGGTFVDLLDTFASEAGVSWFNDYVHPSLVAHKRIADLACDKIR